MLNTYIVALSLDPSAAATPSLGYKLDYSTKAVISTYCIQQKVEWLFFKRNSPKTVFSQSPGINGESRKVGRFM
jgi:hypothetical protein